MADALSHLLIRARWALSIPSQGKLGLLLGSSKHTGQRWERGQARPSQEQLQRLVALVHPKDAELAADLAAVAGTTLEQMGLGTAPQGQAGTPAANPAPPDPIHIVDTVVCAAAEAIHLMPDVVRPALRAAFRRARLAGLSLEAVDAALNVVAPSKGDATSA